MYAVFISSSRGSQSLLLGKALPSLTKRHSLPAHSCVGGYPAAFLSQLLPLVLLFLLILQ